MQVLESKFQILNDLNGLDILKRIEKVGRVCYKSEGKITEDGESAKRFVKMLIKNQHEAMLEHGGDISILFTVDRGITHEFVRHRLASFAQESTRYCNYSQEKFGNNISYIDIIPGLLLDGKQYTIQEIHQIVSVWKYAMEYAENSYMKLLDLGVSPQIARSVLPNSTKADITITANLREWHHMLNLRAAGTTGRPHPQMVEIMIPVLIELSNEIPVVFDDILESAEPEIDRWRSAFREFANFKDFSKIYKEKS